MSDGIGTRRENSVQGGEKRSGTGLKETLRHGGTYFISSALCAGIASANFIILARLLPQSDYGVYTLTMGALQGAPILGALNLPSVLSRYPLEQSPDLPGFLGTFSTVVAIWWAITFSVTLIVSFVMPAPGGLSTASLWAIYAGVLGSAAVLAYSQLCVGLRQSRRYAAFNVGVKGLSAGFSVGAL